jgi:hypothetical protein
MMQPLHKRWATAMRRLLEEKEEIHMPFPFSVGDPVIQGTLDWVAPPPPPTPPEQGRDTHAVGFLLSNPDTVNSPEYKGFMFFRPQGTGHGPVGSTPGLDGFGSLQVTENVCQTLLDPTTAVQPPDMVKVFIGFRRKQSAPAHVFATLSFMNRTPITEVPGPTISTLEFSVVRMQGGAFGGNIFMDSWFLSLKRTTVLFRSQ